MNVQIEIGTTKHWMLLPAYLRLFRSRYEQGMIGFEEEEKVLSAKISIATGKEITEDRTEVDENGNPVPYTWSKVASDDLLAKLDSTDSGNPDVSGTFTDTPTYGAKNGLTLADMRGLDYNNPTWDSLLDQLTVEDYDVSINRGGYGTMPLDSVEKPFNVDADTASYLIYGGTGHVFEGPSTLAQTWNQELYTAFGNMIGNESLIGGAAGWYAPSMNIHRTPFSGRNGEYYSEDGFLSGEVASCSVKAAAEKGLYAMIKHFVLTGSTPSQRGQTSRQSARSTSSPSRW